MTRWMILFAALALAPAATADDWVILDEDGDRQGYIREQFPQDNNDSWGEWHDQNFGDQADWSDGQDDESRRDFFIQDGGSLPNGRAGYLRPRW